MEGLRKSIRMAGSVGLAGLGWLAIAGGVQAEWEAPEEEREVPNPIERTAESIEIGHGLYRENCETCHGLKGAGDGPGARVLEARLPNFQDKAWADQHTDGEWSYKIAVGKDPMVGYEDFLEEDEIWHTVNYVRSLSVADAAEAAVEPAAAPTEAVVAEEVAEAVEPAVEAAPVAEEAPAEAAVDEAQAEVAPEAEAEAEATAEPEAHGEAPAEAAEAEATHEEGESEADHADDEETHAAAVGHDGGHGGHGEGHAPAAPLEFDPRAISNYESSHAKAPLIWALITSVIVGGVFVAFQKMVPPPPGAKPAAGGGHGHDDGHGH